MRGKKLLRTLGIAFVLLLWAPAGPAQANAPAPVQKLTLVFTDQDGQAITPAAIQIARCDSAADPACSRPQLIAQHGACDAPACLSDAGFLEERAFICGSPAANVCVYSAYRHGLPSWPSTA